MTPTFIAEVKTRSPWGYRASQSWDELLALACEIGDWVAVHTDHRWGGSFERLRHARAATDKPLVAKGIHKTDEEVDRAIACGADYVLVVGRLPYEADRCLIEPTTLDELEALPDGVKAVWNSRDLTTGERKDSPFAEARDLWSGWLCQASHLTRPESVHRGANAFLVGTALAIWKDAK